MGLAAWASVHGYAGEHGHVPTRHQTGQTRRADRTDRSDQRHTTTLLKVPIDERGHEIGHYGNGPSRRH